MWGRIVPPAPLVSSTVKAAALAVVGETSAVGLGLISAEAFALSQGVIHAMTLTQLKAAFAAVALTGTMLTGAGVYAYQTTGSNPPDSPTDGAVKAASATTPDAATKPSRLDPLTRLRKDANVVFAEHLSDPKIEKTQPHINGLVQWSHAIRDSQEFVGLDQDALNQARKDHLDRMTLLHQFTQRLNGPEQPAMADTARLAKEEAARDLTTAGIARGSAARMNPRRRDGDDGRRHRASSSHGRATAAVRGWSRERSAPAAPPVVAGSAPVPPTAVQAPPPEVQTR